MKLKLTRTLWGILDHTQVEQERPTWDALFQKLKSEGYEAIETSVGPFWPFAGHDDEFKALMQKYKFDFVGQLHTCDYPVSSRKVADHLASYRQYVTRAKALGAVFCNAHSGSDTWSLEEAVEFYTETLKIDQEIGLKVVHETHRRRVFYNPWFTRDVVKRVPQLRLNADFSHWVVVGERIFDDKYDDDWVEILKLLAPNIELVHARVGYAEGPQVPDPSAPEYQNELEAHEKWWQQIWAANAAKGVTVYYVEPEFGPPPYLHTLPHTNVPVADLWKINSWVGRRVQTHFAKTYSL